MSDFLKDASPRPWQVDRAGERSRVRDAKSRTIAPYGSALGGLLGEADAVLIVEAVNSYDANQAALVKARELAERVTRSWDNSNAELKAIGMRPNPDSHAPLYLKTARELLKLLPEVKP